MIDDDEEEVEQGGETHNVWVSDHLGLQTVVTMSATN